MPVKWTAENNELLLLKILETHDIKLNTANIVAAWPTDKGEVPTPRAISERLVTIRKNLGVAAKGKMSISKTASESKGSIDTPVTPTRFKAINDGSSESAKKKTNKRKLIKGELKDEDDSDAFNSKVSPKELSSLFGNGYTQDHAKEVELDEHETPTKRARSRRASVNPSKKYNDEGDEDSITESDISSFEIV